MSCPALCSLSQQDMLVRQVRLVKITFCGPCLDIYSSRSKDLYTCRHSSPWS